MAPHDLRNLSELDQAEPPAADVPLTGRLNVFVAFDWGDEIDLARAKQLAPSEVRALPQLPRTPSSITYKPLPVRFRLAPVSLSLPGLDGALIDKVVATVFDFGAVSVSLVVPFRLCRGELTLLAGRLADSHLTQTVTDAARAALTPLYEKIKLAIQNPLWRNDLWEEYFVFQFPPDASLGPPTLLGRLKGWTAGLVRTEDQPLSKEEVEEAVRLFLRYGQHDLLVPDWAAALLIDREPECEETLHVLEFANLQLLEYRHIDDRLDRILTRAYDLLHGLRQSRFPLWRSHAKALRVLGELRVEANGLFERTGNVFKLIGDQYLARAYRMLADRFHLREWGGSIQRKLEVVEGVYQVISGQAASFRTEFLEIIVILLILVEIVLALIPSLRSP